MEPLAQEFLAGFRSYLDGALPLTELKQWLVESTFAVQLFGEAAHREPLALAPGAQEKAVCARLREVLGDPFPEDSLRYRARRICVGLVDGSVDWLTGVREMRILSQQRAATEIVPIDWASLDSGTTGIPLPAQYEQWEPKALAERIAKLERYRPVILKAAREFLAATA